MHTQQLRDSAATHCSTLQHTAKILQPFATHCNTLQQTANTLRHTAHTQHITSRSIFSDRETSLQHTAAHCSTLQHTTLHCQTLQHSCNILCTHAAHHWDSAATHCGTLHHSTIYCCSIMLQCSAVLRSRVTHTAHHLKIGPERLRYSAGHQRMNRHYTLYLDTQLSIKIQHSHCHQQRCYHRHVLLRLHINESRHTCTSHGACVWVMAYMKESWHIWIRHVTYVGATTRPLAVLRQHIPFHLQINESWHMWMCHGTCVWVMAHINES